MMLGELFIPAAIVLAVDQASKKLVLERLGQAPPRSSLGWKPRLRPLPGGLLALGPVVDRRTLVIVWGLAVIGTVVLVSTVPAFQSSVARIGLGAALGGATGNLIDWMRRGAVTDFIDLRVWPVFNLADASIVLGVGTALWSIQSW